MKDHVQRVFGALRLLRPYDIDVDKTWVGNQRDGGYVLADVPSQSDVLSFGVGGDSSFESALADRGRRIFMYDHTVNGPVGSHHNFSFIRKGVCGENERAKDLLTLSEHVSNIPDVTQGRLLKMDVEGAEWDALSTAPSRLIESFEQIVLEIHWLQHLFHPPFADKVCAALINLNQTHTLFHVHSNNFCELHLVGGFTVPSVLEVSYIKTSLVQRNPSQTLYPHAINKANLADKPDHCLLFYPFMPSSIQDDDIAKMIDRI